MEEITHILNKKEVDDEFIKKLKYFARGVKDGDRLLKIFLSYFNKIETYISDVELENLRLVRENEILIKRLGELDIDFIDTSNELISGLYQRLRFINKKIK